MKDFNQQNSEWERLQDNNPGGPGDDQDDEREVHEIDWEEVATRKREARFDTDI